VVGAKGMTMTILGFVILALVLLGALYFKKSYPGPCNLLLIILSVLILAVSIHRFLRSEGDALIAQEAHFGSALGAVLGKAIAADFPDGAVVAIIQPAPVAWADREIVYHSTVRAMKRVLAGDAYSVHILQQASPPDGEPLVSEYLSEKEFRALLAQVPGVNAVVLQYIVFEPASQSQSADFPPIYIIAGAEAGIRERLMNEGYVRAMADYRAEADLSTQPARGMTDEDIFNLRFELIRSVQ